MNEYEITNAWHFAGVNNLPNLGRCALILSRLATWTNQNSDGWAYWTPPQRASARLQAVLEEMMRTHYRDVQDIPEAELGKLFTPIKAFLTRRGVDHSEVFTYSGSLTRP